jgi:hypothetical protein
MYLFASRDPLGPPRARAEISAALRATPSGRLVEAWLETARQLDEGRARDEGRRAEIQRLREVISDKDGELKQLWTELALAAQTIADGRSELEQFRERVGNLDEVGPTAARLTRALTRMARRFPAVARTVKRLLVRRRPAA